MGVDTIGVELRRAVRERASYRCEYCLISEQDAFFGCHIDHVISRKHGGESEEDNLALACVFCNRNKGTDIAALDPSSGNLVRLFHPRIDRWADHFQLAEDGCAIAPLSAIGRATERLLKLNAEERLLERRALREAGS